MRRVPISAWLLLCVLCLNLIPVHSTSRRLVLAIYEEPPYQFVDSDGAIRGLLIDLFDAVAELAGYQAEYRRYPSMRDCVTALENQEVDLILGMSGANSFMLSETAELYTSPLVIVGNTNYISQQPNLRGQYTAGYGYHATEKEIIYSLGADRYIISDRTYGLVGLLAKGTIDVAVLDRAVLDYALAGEYQGLDIQVTNSYLDTVKYTVACTPGDSSLLRKLNTAILDLRIGGSYEEIKSQWFPKQVETDWKVLLFYVLGAMGLMLVIFGIYYFINRRIHRLLEDELQKKTQDIRSANRQLESQVKQLQFESELRSKLIKTARNGMVMVDREGRVQLMNRSANRMAGFPAQAAGMPVTQLPCFQEVLTQVEEDLFAPGFSIDNRQVTLQGREDEPASVFRLNIQQIVELDQVTGALITLENITEEQRTLRASYEEEKNRTLNHIVAGIAHEIKNPLMSIRTYASLIPLKMDDAGFQKSFAEFVPREADRINNLVESLVSYARPAKGAKGQVDLCRLVQECAYLSQVAKRKAPIEVALQTQGAVYIYANPDQIKQVVINMMLNGIEAMEEKLRCDPEGGGRLQLSVSVERAEKRVLLTISDNGIGMNQEERQKCTSLFYTTKRRGTGMGLALSEQFIRENDGWLEIVSKEGEFTRFLIYFPAAEAASI